MRYADRHPTRLSPDEIDALIADVTFPIYTEDLLSQFRNAGASERTLKALGDIPEHTYQDQNELRKALLGYKFDPENEPHSSTSIFKGSSSLPNKTAH
ncbi:DUF2795 domain-containing protein [Lujinxingia vulgaris]|uniref:DUF2795 domain-containing protein n=1 Tax=Lujinxingia vulgaris TaxID=2600176 RepID=A0A5C6X9P5_9DELT|nr:DUF2795 domain-containing protein [Lujinxingia vulgaris]TXD34742.1 DUF2795 domain-containing protein [Lujinxingia vulgaris]